MVSLWLWPSYCLAPYLASRHYEKAIRFQSSGDLAQAVRELEKATEYNPGQAFFHRRLGDIAMERFSANHSEEMSQKAFREFSKAIQLNPIHPPFWHTLARYHEFMVTFSKGRERDEHIELAASAYEKAMELAPTNPFYRVSLAALRIKAGQQEMAVGPLRQALRLEPNFITAKVMLIDLQEKLGRTEEASDLKADLKETVKRISGLKPMNDYEARLLMDPARYFKDQG